MRLAASCAAVALMAVLAGGLAADPARAEEPVASQAQWRRVAQADGAIAVSIPCAKADTQEIAQAPVFMVSCEYGGLSYIASVGVGDGQGEFGKYAETLASARKDPSSGKIVETTLGGRPAFTVVRPDGDPVGYGEFVDLAPGKLVMLIAFEADEKPRLTGAARRAADADAQRFVASLELAGK